MFYTPPTEDGAIAVTCDQCFVSVGCPDPFAAATAITHHHCHPDTAMPSPEDRGLALDHQQPALHLLARLWVASCATCSPPLDPPHPALPLRAGLWAPSCPP